MMKVLFEVWMADGMPSFEADEKLGSLFLRETVLGFCFVVVVVLCSAV